MSKFSHLKLTIVDANQFKGRRTKSFRGFNVNKAGFLTATNLTTDELNLSKDRFITLAYIVELKTHWFLRMDESNGFKLEEFGKYKNLRINIGEQLVLSLLKDLSITRKSSRVYLSKTRVPFDGDLWYELLTE